MIAIPAEVQTFFLAMVPVLELRAALPVALLVHQINPLSAYLWSVAGNIVPVFVILSFFDPVSLWLSERSVTMKRFFTFIFEKTRKNYNGKVERYGYLTLALFTAVPLPVTGAWTASLVVLLFGLKKGISVLSITVGVLCAGLAILFITQAGVSIEESYGFQALGGVIFLILLVYFILRKKKIKNV